MKLLQKNVVVRRRRSHVKRAPQILSISCISAFRPSKLLKAACPAKRMGLPRFRVFASLFMTERGRSSSSQRAWRPKRFPTRLICKRWRRIKVAMDPARRELCSAQMGVHSCCPAFRAGDVRGLIVWFCKVNGLAFLRLQHSRLTLIFLSQVWLPPRQRRSLLRPRKKGQIWDACARKGLGVGAEGAGHPGP